ncbi:MAG: DUF3891 family protein [Armatimonadetes bacterium]|nr:DUF3891 family protein [Anaerolineae bacterium]
MIVNHIPEGWEVIYQPAHALLAARLIAHWRIDQRPARWIETLVALAQHDDEATEWAGRNHLTDVGAPQDFTLSLAPSLAQPEMVTQDLQYKGQWATLLISMHMCFLYDHLRADGAEYAAFLDSQHAYQKEVRTSLKLSKKEADAAYALFQWADALSLILCRRQLPEGGRALEVSAGPDGTRYDVIDQAGVVTVRPWPFQEEAFTVTVETFPLTQLKFKDDAELQHALHQTPVTELSWDFKRTSGT